MLNLIRNISGGLVPIIMASFFVCMGIYGAELHRENPYMPLFLGLEVAFVCTGLAMFWMGGLNENRRSQRRL